MLFSLGYRLTEDVNVQLTSCEKFHVSSVGKHLNPDGSAISSLSSYFFAKVVNRKAKVVYKRFQIQETRKWPDFVGNCMEVRKSNNSKFNIQVDIVKLKKGIDMFTGLTYVPEFIKRGPCIVHANLIITLKIP